MTHPLYPCIWFDGQAKAAAELYCSLFNNSKITAENPMVVTFEINGFKVMGLNGGPMFKINPAISLFVNCESVQATNELWDKLIVGGKALMAIDQYPWSERYGWLQDQFGVTWQLSVVNNPGDPQQISPSLLFTGNRFGQAEAAIHFYSKVFKNAQTDVLMHYPPGDESAGKLMYGEFKLNGYNLIAMDGPGEHNYTFNEAVSFVVTCDTQAEIDYYWEQLTMGGEESQCGWLKDQFGISWQIVPTALGQLMSDPDKAPRVVQAFMKMKKFDIEQLMQA